MPDNEQPEISKAEEQFLNHLALLSMVVQNRLETPKPPEPAKSLWSAFREPSVLAALVTVLIGGVVATLITGIIQWRAGVREYEQSRAMRDREFEQAWLKARGDQALESYKEYLEQEQALIRRTYGLIGTCTSASDKLAGLTRGIWRQKFTGDGRVSVDKQITSIRENFNQTYTKWQAESSELGLLMGYYHPSQPRVMTSWLNVEKAVTGYLDCAQAWHDKHPASKAPPSDQDVLTACKSAQETLMDHLTELTGSLEFARRYAWTGWDSPLELKKLLQGNLQ